MVSYFLSDIHLKSLDDKTSRLLLFFLRKEWAKAPGDIYLLGDIFDIWVSDHKVFIEKYRPLIDELKKVKAQGFKVVYFEGNHDLHLKKYWKEALGFDVYFDVGYFTIDDHVFRLEHGDLINQDDEAYLRLRRTLRTPAMITLGHWLPGRFWSFVGEKWSRTSRKGSYSYLAARKESIIKMVRDHAQKVVMEKPFDYIITGHMHVVDDFEFTSVSNSKRVRSVNLGTWLDGAKVLKYENNNLSWLNLEDLASS